MAKKGKGGKSGSAKKGGKGDEAAAQVVGKALQSVLKKLEKCGASVVGVPLSPAAKFNPTAPFNGALLPLVTPGVSVESGATAGTSPSVDSQPGSSAIPPPTPVSFALAAVSSSVLCLDHNSGLGTLGVSRVFDAIRVTSMKPDSRSHPDDGFASAQQSDVARDSLSSATARPQTHSAGPTNLPIGGCRLVRVSVKYCDAGEDAAGSIGRALEINSTIIDLDLSGNALSNGGVLHLAPYLARNTTLQRLNLSSNLISDSIPTAESLLKIPAFSAPFNYTEALERHVQRHEESLGSTSPTHDAQASTSSDATEPVLLSPIESLACAMTAPANPASAMSFLDLRSNDIGDHGGRVVVNLLKARKGKLQVKIGERMQGEVFGGVLDLSDLAAGGGKKGKGKGGKKK
ncbi:hypothetical protein HDU93_009590 [Gonapodya sp. JEL0774]|nr:hypothetical protein HDU93_009590 [Gonapodya sp. JEL0774]